MTWKERVESIVRVAEKADELGTPDRVRYLRVQLLHVLWDVDGYFEPFEDSIFDLWRGLFERIEDAETGDDSSLRVLQSELVAMVNAVVELRVARTRRDQGE